MKGRLVLSLVLAGALAVCSHASVFTEEPDAVAIDAAAFDELIAAGPVADDAAIEASEWASAVKAAGTLKVGGTRTSFLFSQEDETDGSLRGFDAGLYQLLARYILGDESKFELTQVTSDTRESVLTSGQVDTVFATYSITDARKEQALMSEGYLVNGKTIICRSEDAAKYTDLESINKPEVRVMVNPGGLNEKFARENLPDVTLIVHDVNQDIPGLIAEGAADIMITEIMEAGYYVGQDERLAAPLINEPFTHGELGVLMPKGSEDLLEYVNAFLEEEKRSGRLDDLADEYIYQHQEKELAPAA